MHCCQRQKRAYRDLALAQRRVAVLAGAGIGRAAIEPDIIDPAAAEPIDTGLTNRRSAGQAHRGGVVRAYE
jgi:hypothetical protein